MEDRPGDSKAKGAVDRRLPCSVVVFNSLTAIPTFNMMVTEVRAGAMRLSEGKQFNMPTPFIDPVARTIWIEGREYPLERVHYWERAKTAYAKEQQPEHDYTMGRRRK